MTSVDRGRAAGRYLPALTGLLLPASYYLPTLVLNVVAFWPLLFWIDRQLESGRPRLFGGGFVFGFVYYFAGMHFWAETMRITWLAGLLWVLFSAVMALRAATVVWVVGKLRASTGFGYAFLLPICFVPVEWLSTFGDLRMTGDHLAYSLVQYPFLIQFADLVGHYGVSTLVLCVNGLAYQAWRDRASGRRLIESTPFRAVVALILVVVAYDAWSWWRPRPAPETLRVGLVQPDIPLGLKREGLGADDQWATLVRLTEQAVAGGAELVIWPESSHPYALHHWLDRPGSYGLPRLQGLARRLDVTILFGVVYNRIVTVDSYDAYNAAMVIDREGLLSTDWGAKVYLVPFAEGLPFRDWIGSLVEGREGEAWRWIDGGFRPGPNSAMLDAAGARVGVVVCYEQLFPDLPRDLRNAGAEFQAVITNDAWWGRMPFQRYQANALRLRAVESRTEIVRVANTGISGFVDRLGRYHDQTDLFVEAVEWRDVEISSQRTLYNRIGDAVAWIGLILFVAVATRALRRQT